MSFNPSQLHPLLAPIYFCLFSTTMFFVLISFIIKFSLYYLSFSELCWLFVSFINFINSLFFTLPQWKVIFRLENQTKLRSKKKKREIKIKQFIVITLGHAPKIMSNNGGKVFERVHKKNPTRKTSKSFSILITMGKWRKKGGAHEKN